MTPEAARDTALAAQTHAADPRLLLAVDAVIERYAASGRRFSANELRDDVPTLASHLVGNRLRAAFMRKELVPVGKVRSTLRSTHAKEICTYVGAEHVEAVAS
jgi:hypothetical protein